MQKHFLINDSISPSKHIPIKTFDIKCKPNFKKDSIKSMLSHQLESRKMHRGIISAASSTHHNIILKLSKDGDPLFHRNRSQSFSPAKTSQRKGTSIHSSRVRTAAKHTYSNPTYNQTTNNYKHFPMRKTLKNNSPYKLYMFPQDRQDNEQNSKNKAEQEYEKQLHKEFNRQMRYKARSAHNSRPIIIPFRSNNLIKEAQIEPWNSKQEQIKFEDGF